VVLLVGVEDRALIVHEVLVVEHVVVDYMDYVVRDMERDSERAAPWDSAPEAEAWGCSGERDLPSFSYLF
jgi:hypothetical protein